MSISSGDEALNDAAMLSPESGEENPLKGMTLEEQERQKEEWARELAGVEEEIQTLRHVLAAKVKAAHELKRKLGFSVWKELQDDMTQGLRNVKESNVYQNVEEKFGQIGKAVVEAPLYQKTESVFKSTAEKTTSIIGGFGSGITSKLGQLKNSESFRSFEEKVGSAYENVKTRVAPSRSNSMQNFPSGMDGGMGGGGSIDPLKSRSKSVASTPLSPTTPTIPE